MKIKLYRRSLITGTILGITFLMAPKFWKKKGNRLSAWGDNRDRPNFDDGNLNFFTPAEYILIYDLAEHIIPSEGEAAPGASDIQLANRIDRFISQSLERDVQAELRNFLEAFASGSELLRGASFSNLSPEEQREYILFWKDFPSLSLLRGGFLSLKRLITAVYFSTKEAWDYIDYGGPLNVYINPFREAQS